MATFTVTTVFDEPYGGFETANSPDNTGLSLREAIGIAAATAGDDIIDFAPSLIGSTFELTEGALLINDTDQITILGSVSLDAKSRFGVFDIDGGNATLDGLTLTGGSAAAGGAFNVASGAGLTLVDTTVTGNDALGGGGGGYVAGTLTAVNATFADNEGFDNGGGLSISSTGVVTLANVSFHGNLSGGGGGAIRNEGQVAADNITVTGSSGYYTGAVSNGPTGTLTLNNSILVGNTVGSLSDGGVDLTNEVGGTLNAGGTTLLGQATSVGTITDTGNTAASVFAATTIVNGVTAGVLADNGGAVETVLILAGGAADDTGDATVLPADVEDVDGDGDTIETLPLDARGAAREVGAALDLGALELTKTLTVTTALDQAFDGGTLEQERVDGGGLSLREALAFATTGYTITFDSSANGTISLSSELTIDDAVSIVGNGEAQTILDAGGLSRVMLITGANGMDVALSGMTLQGGYASGNGGGISASGVDLALTNVSVANNYALGNGGGVHAVSGSTVTAVESTVSGNTGYASESFGGGIYTSGDLSLSNTDITSNTVNSSFSSAAGRAGGVYVGGDLTIVGGSISNNGADGGTSGDSQVSQGGGAFVVGNVTIDGATISDNTLVGGGSTRGGGVYAGGTLELANSTVTGNSTTGVGLSSSYFSRGGGIYAGGAVTIANSTLSNNAARSEYGATFGGGLYAGGTLDLTATTLSGNNATSQYGDAAGGGVFSDGAATLTGTTLSGNTASANASYGLYYSYTPIRRAEGGGIKAAGGLTMTGGTISGNTAETEWGRAYGGGADIDSAGTLIGVTIDSNTAYSVEDQSSSSVSARGGGLHTGFLRIGLYSSTLSNNLAYARSDNAAGGGIFGAGTIANTTAYGNSAEGIFSYGGGLYIRTTSTLTSSTITGNYAEDSGGGVHVRPFRDITVSNSIIAGNGGNPTFSSTTDFYARDGATDLGGNVISSQAATYLTAGTNAVTDTLTDIFDSVGSLSLGRQTFDAGLLADNGGSVQTVLIAETGVAVDAGLTDNLPADAADIDGDANTTEALPQDARGEARVGNITGSSLDLVDAGAVELTPVGTLTVTTLDDEDFGGGDLATEIADGAGLSLREAIGLVNAGIESSTTAIDFESGLGTLLTLSNNRLEIEKSVTIDGAALPGLTLDAINGDRHFDVETSEGSTVTLANMTLTNGTAIAAGAVLHAEGALTVDAVRFVDNDGGAGSGGAILSISGADALIVQSSYFSGNTSQAFGGAISSESATIDITDSEFTGNSAAMAGAIYSRQAATIAGSDFSNNDVSTTSLATGGAIRMQLGALDISDSTFSTNTATATASEGIARGGAIYGFQSDMTVTNTTVTDSRAQTNNAGTTPAEIASGGAFYLNAGSLVLTQSSVESNTAQVIDGTAAGGGLSFTNSASATIIDTEISDNLATIYVSNGSPLGGGVYLASGASLETFNTTISGNSAVGGFLDLGGGLAVGTNALASATLVNTTFHGNSANNGGAIYHGGNVAGSTIELIHSTVTGNTGANGAGLFGKTQDGTLRVENSIVTGNYGYFSEIRDVLSGGGNVISSNTALFTADATDVVENDASLVFGATETQTVGGYSVTGGQLSNNGGSVRTVMLNETGVAVDHGLAANVPATDPQDLDGDSITAEALPVDARGQARQIDLQTGVEGLAPDAGALELQNLSLLVTTLDDETFEAAVDNAADGNGLSLREAIGIANSNSGEHTITFDESLAGGTIFLGGSGLLELTRSIHIDGDIQGDGDRDITLDANSSLGADDASSGHFYAGAGAYANGGITATLEGLTLVNAASDPTSVGIVGGGDLVLTNTGITGGATGGVLVDRGNVTIADSEISGNTSAVIGGVLVYSGDLTLTNSTVSNNTGLDGGGIYASYGTVQISGSTISGNEAFYYGGGISTYQTVSTTIINSQITNNTAYGYDASSGNYFGNGGGLWSDGDGSVTISGTTISGNYAAYDGGGTMIVRSGAVTITDSSITGNTAYDAGGGLNLYPQTGETTIAGSTIANNSANDGGGIYADEMPLGLSISDSTISGNTVGNDGGGIFAVSNADSVLSLTNTTLAHNSAADDGGGLWLDGVSAPSGYENRVSIVNSTVTGNFSGELGGGLYLGSAAALSSITNSIVTGNRAISSTALGYDQAGGQNDVLSYASYGTSTFASLSIIGGTFFDASGSTTALGDQATVAATIFDETVDFVDLNGDGAQQLGDGEVSLIGRAAGRINANGGQVETAALLATSDNPAINEGDSTLAVDGSAAPLSNDARGVGFDRVVAGEVDLGAFEAQLPLGFLDQIAEFGTTTLDSVGGTISLSQSYVDPIVFARINSANEADPVTVRITRVGTTSFDAFLEEPEYLDEIHGAEAISYFVVEKGAWIFEDGTVLEAGVRTTDRLAPAGGFDPLAFTPGHFVETPIVLSQVQSFNGSDWVVTRQRDVSSDGFELAMQEQESKQTGFHVDEEIGWLAISEGSGTFSGNSLEARLTDNRVSSEPFDQVFSKDFAEPPTVLSQVMSFNGNNTVQSRITSVSETGVTLFAEEETSQDAETFHFPEDTALLALSGSGTLFGAQATDRVIAETGTFEVGTTPGLVTLTRDFENPVVFATVQSDVESDPVAVRFDNVTSNSFEILLQEPSNADGTHAPESLRWIVLEAGTWELSDGTRLEVGTIESDLVTRDGFESVNFAQGFSETPAVFSQIQTFNGTDWTVTRQDGADASGFDVAMQEEERLGSHWSETIGWFAIDGTSGTWDGLLFESGIASEVDDSADTFVFNQSFAETPGVIGALASFNGSDTAVARVDNVTSTDASLRILEETTLDTEVAHLPEDVSYFAIGGEGVLTGGEWV
ncbi:choice-of-anchor Q domain-containing protein [Lutimaribacter marinistellae]|uniref:Choice-of-anchor Q domain-containing protein n=1 Tax=Lutimaribacter marinistellae TaxID=1820329 RepID=A0ABV7TCX0_9RHOB